MFQQKVFSLMECRGGGHDPGFNEILGHSPHPAFIKLKSFCWNTWIYKVSHEIRQISHEICWISHEICQIAWNPLDFMWNLPDFMNMSFWVITKYRSFFWKTKNVMTTIWVGVLVWDCYNVRKPPCLQQSLLKHTIHSPDNANALTIVQLIQLFSTFCRTNNFFTFCLSKVDVRISVVYTTIVWDMRIGKNVLKC